MVSKYIDTDHLLRLYKSGMSGHDIANIMGIGTTTVYRKIKEAGLAVREHRKNIDTSEVLRLYESGVSVKALGKLFGCDGDTIHKRLVENGVHIRGRSDAMYIRMAQTTAEERTRLTDAAHAAVRGKSQTEEHVCKIAITREIRQTHVSRTEEILTKMLIDRGMTCTAQKAFGRYNVDIALDEFPIVVEVFGGGWHAHGTHASRYAKRTKYLLDCGQDVIGVWVNGKDFPLESGAADYIVSVAHELCREKTVRGKEHMIWGNGQSTSVGQCKFNNVPVIPPSKCRDKITGQFKPRPFDETMMM